MKGKREGEFFMSDDDIMISTSMFLFFSFIALLAKTHTQKKRTVSASSITRIITIFFPSLFDCPTIAGFRVTLATGTGDKGERMMWVAGGRRSGPLLLPEFLKRTLDALLCSIRFAHTLTLSKLKGREG